MLLLSLLSLVLLVSRHSKCYHHGDAVAIVLVVVSVRVGFVAVCAVFAGGEVLDVGVIVVVVVIVVAKVVAVVCRTSCCRCLGRCCYYCSSSYCWCCCSKGCWCCLCRGS